MKGTRMVGLGSMARVLASSGCLLVVTGCAVSHGHTGAADVGPRDGAPWRGEGGSLPDGALPEGSVSLLDGAFGDGAPADGSRPPSGADLLGGSPELLGSWAPSPDSIVILSRLLSGKGRGESVAWLTTHAGQPLLLRVDPHDGVTVTADSPFSPLSQPVQGVATLEASDTGYAAVVALAPFSSGASCTEPRLAEAQFDATGSATGAADLGPFDVGGDSCIRDGTAFGAGDVRVAATAVSDRVMASIVRRAADGSLQVERRPLVQLASALPAPIPLQGALLSGGRFAIVGGGVLRSVSSGEPIVPAFLAVGALDGDPATPRDLPGLPSDPSPRVATEPDGFSVFRYVTDTDDVTRSGIHRLRYGADATLRSDRTLSTAGGLAPVGESRIVASEGGPARLIWLERSTDGSGSGRVRMAPRDLDGVGWGAVDVLDLPVLPYASSGSVEMSAVLRDDGLYLAILGVMERGGVTVFRIPTRAP